MANEQFTVIDDGRAVELAAQVVDDSVRLTPAALRAGLGWELKPAGLCRGALCVPVRDGAGLVVDGAIDLAAFARVLQRPFVLDVTERVAALGVAADERAAQLATLEAPEFELPDLDGRRHALSQQRGKKVLLVAYASWCGCRYDLPAWQALHEELEDEGFTVITVALDKSADDARPFIEAAQPTHPSLVDSDHRLADLYGMINVPTAVWIDEEGRIARPNEVAFGNDMFKELTNFESAAYLDAVRAWVREGRLPFDRSAARQHQMLPNADEQLARTEFAVAWHLHQRGRTEAAVRHFARAGELSPNDWTIRRAAMPIMGIDPMTSPQFLALFQEWTDRGRPYYTPRPAG
ncbi:MAG: redoxin domain-containing protein [Candidatus Binatia bacterium]